MSGSQIGIKLADGSFYPVLDETRGGRKRLVLTTVRDNQDTVRIDLFRGVGRQGFDGEEYVGSLTVENIAEAPKSDPEIELILGLDEEGNLTASAKDLLRGESQELSVHLAAAVAVQEAGDHAFEVEREAVAAGVKRPAQEVEEPLLTGETYPIGPTDRRKEHLHRRKRRPLLLAVFIILGLILIAAVALVVFRSTGGQPLAPLLGRAPAQQQETGQPGPGEQAGQRGPAGEMGQQGQAGQAEGPSGPASAGQEAQAVPPVAETEKKTSETGGAVAGPAAGGGSPGRDGFWYTIKWGDTLWDLAATYYRNPWLYPRIARANDIADPDLIIAGRKLFIPEK